MVRKAMGLQSGRSTAGLPQDGSLGESMSLEQLAQLSEVVSRSGADVIKSLAMDEEKLSKMPLASQPSKLRSKLLPYQLQGLAWLTAKETPQVP